MQWSTTGYYKKRFSISLKMPRISLKNFPFIDILKCFLIITIIPCAIFSGYMFTKYAINFEHTLAKKHAEQLKIMDTDQNKEIQKTNEASFKFKNQKVYKKVKRQ